MLVQFHSSQWPWLHLDFVTNFLFSSHDKYSVLVVVDRLLKSLKLLPLPALPMAYETPEHV